MGLHVCDYTCVGVYTLVNVGEQRSQIDLRCHPHSLSTLLSQGHLTESGAHPSGLSNWPVSSDVGITGGPPSSPSFYMCTRDLNCEPHNYIGSILSTKLPLQLQSVISLLL